MKKLASEGDGCNSSMDLEFRKEIKEKTDSGSTEGKAVLDWLEQNAKKNKAKTSKEASSSNSLWKKFRPN